MRNRQTERWKLLRERYRQRGVALVLGAGISTGCSIASWQELLCRMGERCLGVDGRKLVEELIRAGTTLPAIAGILESKRPQNVDFLDLLSEEIYREFPFHAMVVKKDQQRKLVKLVQGKNSTMRAVAALCARKIPDGEFVVNEKIRAVVNFNIDSVLRTYAKSRYGTYLFRTIERASKVGTTGRIPIYHMHGFLKFYRSNGAADKEEVRCVFTEAEYFDFFNRPNSVFNYTFLYLLREFNCLFIGMSMNDENIRRLLHYSTSERREHAVKMGQRPFERIALRHFCILKKSGSVRMDELTDISLRRLGTRALWINNFEEIPHRLAYIYGETAWEKVY